MLLGLAFAGSLSPSDAHAESQVLESDIAALPAGTTIADDSSVSLPDGTTLRVLLLSSGTTKTLKGPYDGTISGYKDRRSWWDRLMGNDNTDDAPIGATRGFKPDTDQ